MKMRSQRLDVARFRKICAFTLTEVLVALLVLALALSALQLRMSQYLDDAAYLREKTVAQWVALNLLEELRLSTRLGAPPPGQALSGTVSMANRIWYWYLEPETALTTDLVTSLVPVRVQVSAQSAAAAQTAPVVVLTGVSDATFSL